ncbi:MAG: hypothetical protein ACK4RK_15770 [Gemmataceae bacterium]
MKRLRLVVMLSLSIALGMTTRGQAQTLSNLDSVGQSALTGAAARHKYVFLFFYRHDDDTTRRQKAVVDAAVNGMGGMVELAAVSIQDPADKALVDRFGVSRAPMPLVLAVAPNGAVTKAFLTPFDARQFQTALVSPATQSAMKAMQDRKLLLLCLHNPARPFAPTALQGVTDFQRDNRYAQAVVVLDVNIADPREETFLQQLQVHSQGPSTVLFMAPSGATLGKFEGGVAAKDQLIHKLQAAQSGCCPGGCCPGGCCGPNGCSPKQ